MKIGFSFGRCIRDIVNGDVDINDVLVIIARTRMENLAVVMSVIDDYMSRPGYLVGLDEQRCREVGTELFQSGRVHQPRTEADSYFGWHKVAENAIWADVAPTTYMNEQVKEAWNHYRFLLNMTTPNIPEKEDYK